MNIDTTASREVLKKTSFSEVDEPVSISHDEPSFFATLFSTLFGKQEVPSSEVEATASFPLVADEQEVSELSADEALPVSAASTVIDVDTDEEQERNVEQKSAEQTEQWMQSGHQLLARLTQANAVLQSTNSPNEVTTGKSLPESSAQDENGLSPSFALSAAATVATASSQDTQNIAALREVSDVTASPLAIKPPIDENKMDDLLKATSEASDEKKAAELAFSSSGVGHLPLSTKTEPLLAASAVNATAGDALSALSVNTLTDANAALMSTSNALLESSASLAVGQSTMLTNGRAEATNSTQAPLTLPQMMDADEMSERVQMMLSKNLKQVDIRLDPPELGKVHIRLNLQGEQAQVQFVVSHTQTREALEHSMPRLREMLNQQGIALADTSVQQQNSGQHASEQQEQNAFSGKGSHSWVDGEQDLDNSENINTDLTLEMNLSSKPEGISYYA